MTKRRALTAFAVENTRAGAARREVPDGGCRGLYLVVQASGVKSWALRYRRPDGRACKLTLGRVDTSGRPAVKDPQVGGSLTIGEARVLTATVLNSRANGADPAAERQKQKREARTLASTAGDRSYPAFARLYVQQHAKPNVRRWRETASYLGLDPDDEDLAAVPGSIAERWRDREAKSIARVEVVAEMDRAAKRARMAPNHLLAALRAMFGWHLERFAIEHSPCEKVKAPVRGPALIRSRRLDDDEVRWLWRALDELVAEGAVPPAYARLVRFVMLTGVRRDEARLAVASELRGDELTVPGARTKNHLDQLVTLSPAAKREIAERRATKTGWLFPGVTGGGPLGGLSKWKAKVVARMQKLAGETDIKRWHLHDFRRSVRSFASRVATDVVAERLLGHVPVGLRKNYDCHDYKREKAAALASWAGEVERIVSGSDGKVVTMSRRRARPPVGAAGKSP